MMMMMVVAALNPPILYKRESVIEAVTLPPLPGAQGVIPSRSMPTLSRGRMMPNTAEAQRKRRMERKTCGGCGSPAALMRVWGAARVPICAGCDEVLRTRSAATAAGLEDVQEYVEATADVEVAGAPSTAPALTAEDLERRREDPEYDNWLRHRGL